MKLWPVVAGLAVIGAGLIGYALFGPPTGDEKLTEDAKAVASAQLRDPSSAQFRNVRVDGLHVCGEINGKNGFGAYTGFVRFHGDGDSAEIDPGEGGPTFYGKPVMKDMFETSYSIYCGTNQ